MLQLAPARSASRERLRSSSKLNSPSRACSARRCPSDHWRPANPSQMAMQVIWEGFAGRQWSDGHLRALQARLGEFNLLEDLRRSLEAERAGANWSINLVRVGRDLEKIGGLDFLNDTPLGPNDWVREAAVVYKMCPAGWYYREQLNYNRMFDDWIVTGFSAT